MSLFRDLTTKTDNMQPQGFSYEHLPLELTQYPQFVLWRRVWLPDKNKFTKLPINGVLNKVSIREETNYLTFNAALKAFSTLQALGQDDVGVGFIFTKNDPFVFVDLDNVVGAGQWTSSAMAHLYNQCGSWAEYSQSGNGIHIIGKSSTALTHIDNDAGLEVYSGGRFVALTGWHIPESGQNVRDLSTILPPLIPEKKTLKVTHVAYPDLVEPIPLESISNVRIRLFLEAHDATPWMHDRSRGLMAAALHLYQLGHDDAVVLSTVWAYCETIVRSHRPHGDALDWLWKYNVLPAQSARQQKIEEMFDPISSTNTVIEGSATRVDTIDSIQAELDNLVTLGIDTPEALNKAKEVIIRIEGCDAAERILLRDSLRRIMAWTKSDLKEISTEVTKQHREQKSNGNVTAIFDDYVYVACNHAFMHKESFKFLRPEAFLAMHHTFGEDLRDQVLGNNGVLKVHSLDFDPDEPQIFQRDKALRFNTWRGIKLQPKEGDASPWLRHAELLMPVAEERKHVFDWMAFTLQHPGIKINHSILLGGNQGIGKDTLFEPLTRSLGRHARTIKIDDLRRDFNGYLYNTKLLILNEADIAGRPDESQIVNIVKPLMSSPPNYLTINPKNKDEYEIRNIVNTVLFSNEVRPTPISDDDRRHFIVTSDLNVIDYSTGSIQPQWAQYFDNLWSWLETGGVEIVLNWLLSRDLSHFNAKKTPPTTKSKRDLQEATQRPLDLILKSAIEGKTGPFALDVVSSENIYGWLSQDAVVVLKQYGIENVTMQAIGAAMKRIHCLSRRSKIDGKRKALWIVRNKDQLGPIPEGVLGHFT